jgi:hypothetical protein
VEERLDLEGFRRPGKASGDEALWKIWEANDMDAGSQRAHVEALALGRSYVTVGAGDGADDAPVICDETALDMVAVDGPADPEDVGGAATLVCRRGDDQGAAAANRATLYLPDATIIFRSSPAAPGRRTPATSMTSARYPWCRS